MQGCVYSATSLLIYNFCWRLLSNWMLALAALHLIFPYLSAVSFTAPVCWITAYYSNCNAQWKTPERRAPRDSHIWLLVATRGLDGDLSCVLSFCSVSSKSEWCKQNKPRSAYSLATIVSKTCSSPRLLGFLIMLQFVLPRKAAQVTLVHAAWVQCFCRIWNETTDFLSDIGSFHLQELVLVNFLLRSNCCGCSTAVCTANNTDVPLLLNVNKLKSTTLMNWAKEVQCSGINERQFPTSYPILSNAQNAFYALLGVSLHLENILRNTWKQRYYCFFPVMVHTAVLHVACCARCPLTLNAKC